MIRRIATANPGAVILGALLNGGNQHTLKAPPCVKPQRLARTQQPNVDSTHIARVYVANHYAPTPKQPASYDKYATLRARNLSTDALGLNETPVTNQFAFATLLNPQPIMRATLLILYCLAKPHDMY